MGIEPAAIGRGRTFIDPGLYVNGEVVVGGEMRTPPKARITEAGAELFDRLDALKIFDAMTDRILAAVAEAERETE